MEKIRINNQVILMRKHVKQAKVHTINKLVKQIKLLQNHKGNDTQVQKAKRKANRYLEEVVLLRKMKPDFISKQALSKEKDWKDVLIQRSSTVEDRCLAILANYESVQKEVEKFHSANPNLVSKIPDLIKEWELKSKLPKPPDFKKKKQNNPFSKYDKFSNSIIKQNESKLNISEENEELDDVDNNLTVGDHLNAEKINMEEKLKKEKLSDVCGLQNILSTEACETNTVIEKNINDEISNKGNESNEHENVSDFLDSESDAESLKDPEAAKSEIKEYFNNDAKLDTFDKSENSCGISNRKLAFIENSGFVDDDRLSDEESTMFQKSQQTTSVQKSKIPTENNLKTIAVLNLEDLEGLDEIPIKKETEDEEAEENNSENNSPEMSSDPFFLRPEEYSTIARKMQFEKSREKKNTFPPIQNTKGMNRFERRNGRPKRPRQEFDTDFNFTQKRGFAKGKFQPRNQEKYSNRYGENELHSSGQNIIRKKEQMEFSDFKKQSFLDKSNKSPFKKKVDTSFNEKKSVHKKNNSVSDKPLHPSWEAKRKQKELAQTSFQGKRRVFED